MNLKKEKRDETTASRHMSYLTILGTYMTIFGTVLGLVLTCLLYTSPSPRDTR